jgi:hypothetical protein
MNIELTQEQVAAFNRGESFTITPKPKKWEPVSYREFGAERQTKEAAEKACAVMRTHNRLLAYVYEFGGDWVADWNFKAQMKYYINYDAIEDDWWVCWANWTCCLGTVYMSEECAEGLVDKLKSGEVVL